MNTSNTNIQPLDERSQNKSPPLLSSEELLHGQQQLAILHHGEVYYLRLTKQDKLILTK